MILPRSFMKQSPFSYRIFLATTTAIALCGAIPKVFADPGPCIPSGDNIVCEGDHSEGIRFFEQPVLVVQNLSGDIAPAAGAGISLQNFTSAASAQIDLGGNAIRTSGAAGVNLGSANDDMSVDFSGDIITSGDNADAISVLRPSYNYYNGVIRYADFTVVVRSGDISTSGARSDGISAGNATRYGRWNITSDGATITTTGADAAGIRGRAYNSIFASNSADISASGEYSTAIAVSSYYEVGGISNSGDITTTGQTSTALSAFGENAATIRNSGRIIAARSGAIANAIEYSANIENTGAVSTSGERGIALAAFSTRGDAQVENSATLNTAGESSHAISARSNISGVTIENSGDIETTGDGAIGVTSTSGGGSSARTAVTNTGNISTAGQRAHGLTVRMGRDGGSVSVNDGLITTSGDQSAAVAVAGVLDFDYTSSRSSFSADIGSEILTTGEGSAGLVLASVSSGATFDVSGDVTTTGDTADGIILTAAFASADATISSSIRTEGVQARGAAISGFFFSTMSATLSEDSSIVTSGDEAVGVFVGNGGRIDASLAGSVTTGGARAHGVQIQRTESTSSDATIVVSGDITTTGEGADGISLADGTASTSAAISSSIRTEGDQARGAVFRAFSFTRLSAELSEDSSIVTTGVDAVGVAIDGRSQVTLAGSVTTDGLRAHGVQIQRTENESNYYTGPSTILASGDVTTNGEEAVGIFVGGGGQSDATLAGSVTTDGDRAHGIQIRLIESSNIAPGRAGDRHPSRGDPRRPDRAELRNIALGDLVVTVPGVVVPGPIPGPIVVSPEPSGQNGTFFVSGDVTTTGDEADGFRLASDRASLHAAISSSIRTEGDQARGAVFSALSGGSLSATLSEDSSIVTTGDEAVGVFIGGSGQNDITLAGSVTTAGARAHGVQIGRTEGDSSGDATIRVLGDVTTTGDDAHALRIESAQIDPITVLGDVTGGDGTGLGISATTAADLALFGAVGAASGNAMVLSDGSDTLRLESGASLDGTSLLNGGDDSVFAVAGSVNELLDAGAGTDTFLQTDAGAIDLRLLTNFESINLSDGDDTAIATSAVLANNVIDPGSGTDALELIGGGTLFGDIASFEKVTLTSGAFAANGIGNSAVKAPAELQVAADAELQVAADTELGDFTNEGVVRIADATALSVGSFTAQAGSQTEIGLSETTSGTIASSGAVEFTNGAILNLAVDQTAQLTEGARYVLASGSSASNDATLLDDSDLFNFGLNLEGGTEIVAIAEKLLDAQDLAGSDENVLSAAAALDALLYGGGGGGKDIASKLTALDSSELTAALRQLAPPDSFEQFEGGALLASILARTSMNRKTTASQRITSVGSAARNFAMDFGEAPRRPDIWVEALGGRSARDADGDISSSRVSLEGIAGGVEFPVTDTVSLGLGVGQSRATLNSNNETRATSVFLTGSAKLNGLELEGIAQTSFASVETERTALGETLRGESDARGFGLSAVLSYPLSLEHRVKLTPEAGVSWFRWDEDDFTETGGAGALTQDDLSADEVRIHAAATLSGEINLTSSAMLQPSVRVGAMHRSVDQVSRNARFVAGSAPFTTTGSGEDVTTVLAGGQVGLHLDNGLSFETIANLTLDNQGSESLFGLRITYDLN